MTKRNKKGLEMDEVLQQTVDLMLSEEYKDRFKAEYYQLYQRFIKLRKMLMKWDAHELDFVPDCPRGIYDMQLEFMYKYLSILEMRAIVEEIEVEPVDLYTLHRLEIK